MSDRTYAQVIIYDCPEDQRAAALAVIRETLGEYINEDPDPDGDRVVIGDRYGDDQCSGDLSEDIAARLIDEAPGAFFRTWTDPAYEWLGSLVIYQPGLGRFDANCDADGTPCFRSDEVEAMLAAYPSGNARDRLYRRVKLGTAWLEAVREAQLRLGQIVERSAGATA